MSKPMLRYNAHPSFFTGDICLTHFFFTSFFFYKNRVCVIYPPHRCMNDCKNVYPKPLQTCSHKQSEDLLLLAEFVLCQLRTPTHHHYNPQGYLPLPPF